MYINLLSEEEERLDIQWQHRQYIAWTKELPHSVFNDHLRDVAEKKNT
jgi:hypothetical protein